MPIYRYVALNKNGKEEKGILNSPSERETRRQLKNRGLFIRSVVEDHIKRERELFPKLSAALYRIPRRNISLFVRQLGTLVEAGLPLDRSLENIVEQTENPYLKKAIIEIKTDIVEGSALSAAMKKQATIFPPVYHNLVAIGEQTGNDEKALIRLADLEDASIQMRNKVTTALAYPAFMIFLLGGIMIFLLAVVFPQIKQLFDQMDRELPLITRVVIWFSDLIATRRVIFPIGLIGGGTWFFFDWKSTKKGREQWERFLLTRPILGSFLRKVLLARFSRNLGVMLQSRVPLIVAFQIVSRVVDNSIFERELLKAIDQIKEGAKISDSFSDSIVMNQMVLGMLSAGEASDMVPEMVTKVADILENDVDAAIQRMSTLIEPIMMVFMGGLIIVIMVSILLPMYSLTNQL